ncbi:hypothetical protein OGATHE_003859 [Ogataea polymorpha]|uniref:Uncharacterized protein n=1 Tax=Ogataea polymorpha TaxID=460523 RepID=A0A9P8T499_9ASCO|nr:hypothetical protein OGATHE_003859 [Ogataea polymorpha]
MRLPRRKFLIVEGGGVQVQISRDLSNVGCVSKATNDVNFLDVEFGPIRCVNRGARVPSWSIVVSESETSIQFWRTSDRDKRTFQVDAWRAGRRTNSASDVVWIHVIVDWVIADSDGDRDFRTLIDIPLARGDVDKQESWLAVILAISILGTASLEAFDRGGAVRAQGRRRGNSSLGRGTSIGGRGGDVLVGSRVVVVCHGRSWRGGLVHVGDVLGRRRGGVDGVPGIFGSACCWSRGRDSGGGRGGRGGSWGSGVWTVGCDNGLSALNGGSLGGLDVQGLVCLGACTDWSGLSSCRALFTRGEGFCGQGGDCGVLLGGGRGGSCRRGSWSLGSRRGGWGLGSRRGSGRGSGSGGSSGFTLDLDLAVADLVDDLVGCGGEGSKDGSEHNLGQLHNE